jgi:large subunit ribosomal protein L10
MNREEKNLAIDDIRNLVNSSDILILFHYRGIKDADFQSLRKTLRSCDGDNQVKVTKNTLLRRAVKGTDYEAISEIASGPTAIAFSDNPSSLAKSIVNFSKNHDVIKIRGGFLGKISIGEDKIIDLSKLGTIEDLRAKLISVLTSAQSNFISSLNYNPSSFVRLLDSYAKSKE